MVHVSYLWASLVAQLIKTPPQYIRQLFDPWIGKIPWRRQQANHSSILAWRIPWTEESGRLQSMESPKSQKWLSDFHFLSHICTRLLEKPQLWLWCLCFSIHCLGLSQLFFQGARVFLISYMHIPCIRDYYKRTVYYWYFTWHWVWETRASYRNTMNNLTCNQWKLQNYSEQRETRREHLIFTAHLGLCQSISQVISSNLTSRASCKAGTNPQGWWTVLPCFTDEDTGIQSNKLTCTE